MATPFLAPAPYGNGIEADIYAAGAADARDERAGTPPHVLQTRLAWLTEYLPDASDPYVSYVLGYAAEVIAHPLHTTRQITAAFTEKEANR